MTTPLFLSVEIQVVLESSAHKLYMSRNNTILCNQVLRKLFVMSAFSVSYMIARLFETLNTVIAKLSN